MGYYSDVATAAKWQSGGAASRISEPEKAAMQSNALDNKQLVEKALIVLVGFLASGALGLLRLAALAGTFGTTAARDSFSTAGQLPELIFVLVAGGALGSSFIPIYARIRQGDAEAAWRLASAVMTFAAAAAAILGVVVAVFAPQIVSGILAPDRSPDEQQLTADMIRVMMLTPFIFSISGLVMGILQSHAAFWLPAIAISMNNIGIIVGALVIAPALPAHPGVGQVGDLNVMGLAYGAVLSAALHLLAQLPGLFKLRAPLRPLLDWRVPGLLDVLRLMGPRVLGLAVVQINFLVNIRLANGMAAGSVAALNIAFTLMFFALGVIGQSVGTAVFPSLAAAYAEGDHRGFNARLSLAIRNVLYLSFPATVVFVLLGEPLFSILERGEWTAESSAAAAWALGFYALGIAGFALLEVLSRAFYALEDTRTPVIVGTVAMLSNIALSLVFIQFIGEPDNLARGAFGGLALANALTTLVESLVLWHLLRRRLRQHGEDGSEIGREVFVSARGSLLAAGIMGIALWLVLTVLPGAGWILALLGGAVGGLVYFGVGAIFDLGEARSLLNPLLRRFGSRL